MKKLYVFWKEKMKKIAMYTMIVIFVTIVMMTKIVYYFVQMNATIMKNDQVIIQK